MRHVDVAVIGGGPAGLMAAIQAVKVGASVILIEKNLNLGEKLLISGRGRCNFTNSEPDVQKFLSRYSSSSSNYKFLNSAFSKFNQKDAEAFFNSVNVPTVHERGGRIFPDESVKPDVKGGQIILNALLNLCKKYGVRILRRSPVIGFDIDNNNKIKRVITRDDEIECGSVIIATGGRSYPKTGSTGDGYSLASKLGHNIIKIYPALVPVKIKESWVKLASGCDLKNVNLSVYKAGEKIAVRFGEMEFAPFGISGPIVMDLSSHIPDWIEPEDSDDVLQFSLDLKPALTHEVLRNRIASDFNKFGSKTFAQVLRKLMPSKIISIVLELSDVPHDKPAAYISSEEIHDLANLIKDIRMTLDNSNHDCGLLSFNHAVITRGGIDLKEVDPGTMQSKLCENLYFAGEILDLNGPSGGFNLQLCWSTGYVAGMSAGLNYKNNK
ncbi:MAG: NAD(P)/FAD-dependent oxidoreductase [Synergistaceae bacterium]|nr:NAD(P)/FAD-dependent oxidoreductase [Synergistaceae bacterium]